EKAAQAGELVVGSPVGPPPSAPPLSASAPAKVEVQANAADEEAPKREPEPATTPAPAPAPAPAAPATTPATAPAPAKNDEREEPEPPRRRSVRSSSRIPTVKPSGDGPSSSGSGGGGSDRGGGDEPKRGRRFGGLPIWGWPLIIIIGLAVTLIVFDVRNRKRYRLRCSHDHLELERGRRLMWPFGFEPVGLPFRRVSMPADADCQTQIYRSQAEGESAYLDFILADVKRALGNPGTRNLKKVRDKILLAMRITRRDPHRARRAEVERYLADVAYRQGKAGLARIENELRSAISHLREAQKRASGRYEDLEDWIEHLSGLLKNIVPTPGGKPNTARIPLPPISSRLNKLGPPSKGLAPKPGDVTPPSKHSAPTDAGPPRPDVGTSSSGGILM
ncbi:MAG: hypothetical protein KC503_19600, partial [Myxococcales bacterium]|nr:hypothetical protein [Myxococcales bacterium]